MSKDKKHTNADKQPTEENHSAARDENSPGKQLTRAREALGLSQQQVADRLHLRINSVQAIEQDTPETGVSETFNKGYVRLYARLVRLETGPLLEAYDSIHKQDNEPAKLQSFSRRVSREAHDQKWNMVSIVVVLLVLGSVIGWWVQQSDPSDDSQIGISDTIDNIFSESESTQTTTEQNLSKQNTNADNFTIAGVDTGPEIVDESLADLDENKNAFAANTERSTVADNFNKVSDSSVNAAIDIVKKTSEQANDIASQTASALTSASETEAKDATTVDMAFTFNKDCWVSIKDKNDEVIAIGVKAKGRVMKVSGLPPIKVILCAPQNVKVKYGDKDIDMSIYDINGIAKFTLPIENN